MVSYPRTTFANYFLSMEFIEVELKVGDKVTLLETSTTAEVVAVDKENGFVCVSFTGLYKYKKWVKRSKLKLKF